MYYQVAKSVISCLTIQTPAHREEMTEAEYFTACAREAALLHRRSPAKVARSVLAALHATRGVQWIVTGKARRENKAGLAVLLRCNPHVLRDIGIATTSFGGLVLVDETSQSADLRDAPTAPAIKKAAAPAIRALPDPRLIRLARDLSPALVPA